MNEQSLQTPLDPPALDPAGAEAAPEQPKEGKPRKRRAGEKNAADERQTDQTARSEQEVPLDLETPAETADQPDGDLPTDETAGKPDSEELGQLHEELTRLRREIASARESLLRQEAELEEFRTLWPDVSLSALPDSVLEDVRRGVPLAAAYALAEHRRAVTARLAEATNAVNQLRSSGAADGDSSGYLSPGEVRAMSPDQVHKHYRQILLSMPKWH